MKQTAVDWAFEQLDEQVFRIDHLERIINISISFEDMMTLKKEAKEMEKEQIEDAYWDGIFNGEFLDGQGYYKETYGHDT
jgi:hypothetical protein